MLRVTDVFIRVSSLSVLLGDIGRYYYNKWMKQRIHTALLELHLGCSLGTGSSQQLLEAAQAEADTPAIAAAAAAAGFLTSTQTVHEAAVTAAGGARSGRQGGVNFSGGKMADPAAGRSLRSADQHGALSSSHQLQQQSRQLVPIQLQQQQQPVLHLPDPVVAKLLSLDAGDLDLMIQHPQALQAQVGGWLIKHGGAMVA